ncbi:hypothetical protein IC220_00975 [Wolbachia endosymbiont of Pentalonia nigronervosa]|uniref:hypothetical protein n=1 Tax=Wolbachia endosymbiont of Pentalonia nigronervosa TaxID=1301914 RepID=UPI00165EFA42|nr:hypothetical protein [Wolbachia endosymbiont of Pentalonia nigronervosa]MBD0391039.1 hypothetical protein [Wolbachia endosymbiont of Pentalonia nigronervosa]
MKFVISAPLIILFLLIEIPSIIFATLMVGTLVIANVILFPDLFFPLWIKERVNLSKVFSIYFSSQLHAINFEDFLKIKNNNRELLVAILKNNNLNVQDVISFHKDYSELVKSITTEIHDHEKSKIIFDYLGLSNVKLLIAKDTYSQHCLHAVYKTCKNNIKVINDIDIRLLKAFIKLDRHSASNSSSGMRATKLSNIIHLLKDHYLAKNISDAFSSNTQSSLVKIIKYFSQKNMDIQELTLLTSMLQDKNVLENLKRIDNINSILPDTLTSEDFSFFLNLRKILCNHTTYCFINNLYSLLSNNRLFDKFDSIPTKVLKDICSTELYITCKNANEVLAFFDCLDDNKQNENILDKLKTAFETDSEVTHALLNNELFNSQDEVSEVMRHENFDGSKVREILNRANLEDVLKSFK